MCDTKPRVLCRQSFVTTLGRIAAAFLRTNLPSESNLLHVFVSIVVHLPLAELEALGVQVAALQQGEVPLDRRRHKAVRA